MPAYTISQLEDTLGSYVESGALSFTQVMKQALPRMYRMGMWPDLCYEVSFSGEYGYISLPHDTAGVLACTVNDRPRPTRSLWHDVRISGRSTFLSSYTGIVDDGYYPIMLDMKDVQGLTESSDVVAVNQFDAQVQGDTTAIPATGYAGAVSIMGETSTGQTSTMTQSTSGDLRFTTSGAVSASVTIDPTGADNSITLTAATAGSAGNSITVAINEDIVATPVSVDETSIIVSTRDSTQMTISGTLDDGEPGLTLETIIQTSEQYGRPKYGSNPGLIIAWTGSSWFIGRSLSDGFWSSTEDVATPDLVTTWTPVSPATGTPTVTAGILTAQQVIDAINASPTASALVTASASGTVTGVVAAVTETSLTGGTDSLGITKVTKITYDNVPADFDLVDPNFPTKVIATIPAGSGVLRYRRFRTPEKDVSCVVHLLLKRDSPANISNDTVVHLGNLGAIKNAMFAIIDEDSADRGRAKDSWAEVQRVLDEELQATMGAAKPTLRLDFGPCPPIQSIM